MHAIRTELLLRTPFVRVTSQASTLEPPVARSVSQSVVGGSFTRKSRVPVTRELFSVRGLNSGRVCVSVRLGVRSPHVAPSYGFFAEPYDRKPENDQSLLLIRLTP